MADTAEIVVNLKDPNGKDVQVNIRNIPMDIFNSSNFENELKTRVARQRPNHTIVNWSATSSNTGKPITSKPTAPQTTSKPSTSAEFGGSDDKPGTSPTSKPSTSADFGGSDDKPGTSTSGKPTTPQTTSKPSTSAEFGGSNDKPGTSTSGKPTTPQTTGSSSSSEFGSGASRWPRPGSTAGTSTAGRPTTPQTTGSSSGAEFGSGSGTDPIGGGNSPGQRKASGNKSAGGTGSKDFPNGRPGSQTQLPGDGTGTGGRWGTGGGTGDSTGTVGGTGDSTGTVGGTGKGIGGIGTKGESIGYCKPLTKPLINWDDFKPLLSQEDWGRIIPNVIVDRNPEVEYKDLSTAIRAAFLRWPTVLQRRHSLLSFNGELNRFLGWTYASEAQNWEDMYKKLCSFNVDSEYANSKSFDSKGTDSKPVPTYNTESEWKSAMKQMLFTDLQKTNPKAFNIINKAMSFKDSTNKNEKETYETVSREMNSMMELINSEFGREGKISKRDVEIAFENFVNQINRYVK